MSVNAPTPKIPFAHDEDWRDRWLFLTPEGESQLPSAVAALHAALGEGAGGERAETERVERIVLQGSYADWLAYLRERRELLERYLERFEADARARRGAGRRRRARPRAGVATPDPRAGRAMKVVVVGAGLAGLAAARDLGCA